MYSSTVGPMTRDFTSQYADGTGVGLGFRRLSIIDLDTGNQPIGNENGSLQVIQNGEIYNYRELRADLVARGHSFATNADTEVIVHLYEDAGPRCVERLNGMFAFALWDEPERRLLLARDRFGKKPLYYADVGGTLLFGSELKSLLEHPLCPRELDAASLSRYLALEYVPAPHAIFEGVRKLPGGHYLVWRTDGARSSATGTSRSGPSGDRPDEEYVEEFRERFRAAVRRRLVSDVPLGAFLSGGIDSSSVVAMMVDALPVGNVKTFSIGFAEEELRRVAALDASRRTSGPTTTRRCSRRKPWPRSLTVADYLDEPLGDASILPTYLLSRFTARSRSRSAATERRAPRRLSDVRSRPLREPLPVPGSLNERVVIPLADRLPVSTKNFSFDFKLKRFLRGAGSPEASATRHGSARSPAEQEALLHARPADPYEEQRSFFATAPTTNRIERLIYLYAKTYLEDDVLVKVDRASMACSLEVRAPFLDVELVEFLGRVPSRLKLHRFGTKELLKRALKDVLPPGIAERPKKGFGIPVAEWLKGSWSEALQDELSRPESRPGDLRARRVSAPDLRAHDRTPRSP